MNRECYAKYLELLGEYIKDEVADEKKEKLKQDPFHEGYSQALCDFIEIMKEKAKEYNIPLSQLSFENFDPKKELL